VTLVAPLVEGVALGLGYAAPIGVQNVFVIRSSAAAPGRGYLRVALVVAAMDISLGMCCLFGVGAVFTSVPVVPLIVLWAGVGYLSWLALRLLGETRVRGVDDADGTVLTWSYLVRTAFMLTWFNPQAIADGSLLLGAYRTGLEGNEITAFAIGIACASMGWFLTLSTMIGLLRRWLRPRAFFWIDKGCAVLLLLLAARLAWKAVTG